MHTQTEKKKNHKKDFRVTSTSKKLSFQTSSNRSEAHYLSTHMEYANLK